MHHTRTTLAAAISIAALGLAACSNANSDNTTPETPPEQTAIAPSSDANTGPDVRNPKDLAAITDPCQLLKPGQTQQLGTGAPVKEADVGWGQPGCNWDQNDLMVSLAPDTVQGHGLSTALRNEGKAQPDGEINGYPIVNTSSTDSSCTIYVGPSESQVLVIFTSTDTTPPTPPCELAKQAGGFVLSNLPPMS